MIPMVIGEGTATAATLVTTVTDMAGTMLTTMADHPLLGVFIAGAVIGLVSRLMKRR